MAIVVLLLWIATAAAGLTLLRAGGAQRRAAAAARAPAPAPARIGAAPLTAQGKPPPIEFAHPQTRAGDHTLLEFSHPALAITGVACWLMFTYVHYAPMAWIAFGTLVAALIIGLGWEAASRRAARHDENPAWSFPPRLLWLHGGIATTTLVLTGLTAVLASRS